MRSLYSIYQIDWEIYKYNHKIYLKGFIYYNNIKYNHNNNLIIYKRNIISLNNQLNNFCERDNCELIKKRDI